MEVRLNGIRYEWKIAKYYVSKVDQRGLSVVLGLCFDSSNCLINDVDQMRPMLFS